MQRENTDCLADVDTTLARLAGDETLLGEVTAIFTRTAPRLLTSISEALSGNDLQRALEQAHSLKGAVATFEAPQVFKCVADVERHAKNRDTEAAAAAFAIAQALVGRLLTELAPMVPRDAELDAQA